MWADAYRYPKLFSDEMRFFNPLSANPTKWSNTLKKFVGNLPANCLSVFDHFVKLALKGLSCSRFDQSSLREVFRKKDVLQNLAKFTEKHLFQSLSFDKVTGC